MKRTAILSSATLSFLFFSQNTGLTQSTNNPVLKTYPAPIGMTGSNPYGATPSNLYTVQASQSGATQNSFVYMVKNIGLAANNWQNDNWNISTEQTTSWTSFDFFDPGATFSAVGSAPVTVQVNMVMPSPAWKRPVVRVLPSASKIVPTAVTQVGNTYQTSLKINFATQYSVELGRCNKVRPLRHRFIRVQLLFHRQRLLRILKSWPWEISTEAAMQARSSWTRLKTPWRSGRNH